MKHLILLLSVAITGALLPTDARAQGTFRFDNFDPAAGLRAPIYGLEPGEPCIGKHGNTVNGLPPGTQTYAGPLLSGTGYTAQVFFGRAGAPEVELQPHPQTTTFSTNTMGYFLRQSPLTLPFPPASQVTVQVRVWDNQTNTVTTWDRAVDALSIPLGKSQLFTVALGDSDGDPFPPSLTGLRSFNLYQPLSLSLQPRNQAVVPGGNVAFQVAVCGSWPTASYQWSKNGVPLRNDGRISGVTMARLTLSNAVGQDGGEYQVTVSAFGRSVRSRPATLWVITGGDGRVRFANNGTGIRSPVYGLEPANPYWPKRGNTAAGVPSGTQTYGGPLLSGAAYTAQLFYGTTDMSEESLQPASGIAMFNSGSFAGFITPQANVPIPLPAGMVAKLQVRAWDNRGGTINSWPQAVAHLTVPRGASAPIEVALTRDDPLIPPALMTNVQSFNLYLPLRLSFERQAGTLLLTWPAGLGIRVQTTTNLLNPDWQDVPGSDQTNAYAIITQTLKTQHETLRLILSNLRANSAANSPSEPEVLTPNPR